MIFNKKKIVTKAEIKMNMALVNIGSLIYHSLIFSADKYRGKIRKVSNAIFKLLVTK